MALSSSSSLQQRRRQWASRLHNNLALSTIAGLFLTGLPSANAQCNPCDTDPNGFVTVPGTGCSQYVQCSNGVAGANQSCNSGLIFDSNIKGCNWDYQVTCAPDPPECTDNGSSSGAEVGPSESTEQTPSCDLPICTPGQTGRAIVPFSGCAQYVDCSNGVPGTINTCPTGQVYSTQIQACNVIAQVTCPPDPTCPPVNDPTAAPSVAPEPIDTPQPTEVPVKEIASGSPGEETKPASVLTSDLLEGLYVIDAHLDANKILITRELFNGGRPVGSSGDTFDYNSFKSSLHTMVTTPVDEKSFYIGTSDHANGRVYGLVNIAAFLSQSVVDSIQYGSCDEVNTDIISGVLPLSNACGQNGLDYQDPTTLCSPSDEKYACNAQWDMRVRGNNVGSSPPPFFCGPADDYGGYTGYWDYVSGVENKDSPTENALQKTDVQGCCWWGRGVIHTRGTCQYGKLNHFLGKKASDEKRPSMFPDVDFCLDPGAACSHEKYPDMKWITGLFRWIVDVQTYNMEDFVYMDELIRFVDGEFVDWSFIHKVSGVVSQGCHRPPCVAGAEFDGVVRKDAFVKTLKLLGLKVNDSADSSRRLEKGLNKVTLNADMARTRGTE